MNPLLHHLPPEAFSVVGAERHLVGECPTWDDRAGVLLWVSIIDGRILSLDPATGERRDWQFEAPVGSFGLCDSGRFVVALRDRIILFDPRTGRSEGLASMTHAIREMRLNDGKVGPDGAFWVGSMDDRSDKQPIGCLYRIDAGGRVETIAGGLKVANGLAWNSAGTTMYFSDSRGPWVDACDFDPITGSVKRRRRFLTLDADIGRPDGAACDTDDCYWSAGPSSGRVNRFSPDGQLLDAYALPNFRPTMPCFGGHDLATLYVTSLTQGLTVEQLEQNKLAGTVLAFRPQATGLRSHRFAA